MDEEGTFYTNHKTTMRRMGFDIGLSEDTFVFKESNLTEESLRKYQNFIEEYDIMLYRLIGRKIGFNCYNDPADEDAITPQE